MVKVTWKRVRDLLELWKALDGYRRELQKKKVQIPLEPARYLKIKKDLKKLDKKSIFLLQETTKIIKKVAIPENYFPSYDFLIDRASQIEMREKNRAAYIKKKLENQRG